MVRKRRTSDDAPLSEAPPLPAHDSLVELYDQAFGELHTGRPEVRWLARHLPEKSAQPLRVLDLGCGTGALLRMLAPRIAEGVGIDASEALIERAQIRAAKVRNLAFACVDDEALPFDDNRFDVVVSFLSFRYLDFNRIFPEILRVLKPGGRFLMVDLVARTVRVREAPLLMRSLLRRVLRHGEHSSFQQNVTALFDHPVWAETLLRHPMRSFSQYRTFFAEMLPSSRFDVLDITPTTRIVALDSGPLGA